MRISIALSILILVLGAMFGWRDHRRLVTSRETHDKLTAEAAQSGISIDPKNFADPVRLTKRGDRGDKDAQARLVAKDFIDFAKEIEAIEKKGSQPDELATQKMIVDFMDRMVSLDSAQLKILIAEIRANKELKDQTRQNLIGLLIMTLSSELPKAALAIFAESADIFKDKDNGMGKHLISTSLTNWAKEDPLGALDWVKNNSVKFPAFVTDDAKLGLISGAATNDPKLAFRLIGELGLTDKSEAVSGIMEAAGTPEERTSALAALREHLATLPDEKARDGAAGAAIGALARGLAEDGFASATQWVAEANLSPSELKSFASGLTYSVKSEETGQWIEWIAENASVDKKTGGRIMVMVGNWTQNDYLAAGKWLSTTPAGPVKNMAVIAYAGTVASYEPQTAAQWAMTLPPGSPRDSLLKRIHDDWPTDDPAAKETFAKEHGIK